MNCANTSRLLDAYVDGELDLPSALAVEEHLEGCSRCRSLRANLLALQSAVRRNAGFETAPEGLRERLRARYAKESDARVPGRSWLAHAVPALGAVAVVALIGYTGHEQTRVAPEQEKTRIVYHMTSSDTAGAALRTLGNHLDAAPDVAVVVVAHNNGVDFLLRGARDETGQLLETTVRRFRERGVEFRVCGNTLVRRKIESSEVIQDARLVPSGIAEIARLQGQEGYVYLRL
jgi:intracellular sulfur oxidation DsrE/DsrF family protein